jgi:hypothetical protein
MTTLETLRSYRIWRFAIFDFASSYAGAWGLGTLLNRYDLWFTRERLMWLIIPAGIVAHVGLKLDTPLNKMVLGPGSNILAQALVGIMIFKGLETKSSS